MTFLYFVTVDYVANVNVAEKDTPTSPFELRQLVLKPLQGPPKVFSEYCLQLKVSAWLHFSRYFNFDNEQRTSSTTDIIVQPHSSGVA